MEKMNNAVKMAFRCSRCRGHLAIVEDKRDNVALFGCPRCDCYLVLLPWHLREFRRRSFFDWKGLMEYIYKTYLDARDSVCK